MSLAAPGGGQNLVGRGGGRLFCILALVSGRVTGEIDLWPEC